MPELTIITATYNRAECLEKCWKSLISQTDQNFQWLIVDDGSTDQTEERVRYFQDETPDMHISYIYKENGGKHTALNASHPYIEGRYIVTLDSDDTFTPDAVELLLKTWHKYGNNEEVGQVIFLKGFSKDSPICYVEHEDTPVDTLKEPRIGTAGRDCCDSYRTELFTRHPFPEFPGERFIGEGSAFLFIELECKGVYINKVIYLCDYRDDGLTKAGRKMRILNPLGGRYNSKVYMDKRLPLKMRVKKGILYSCYSSFAGIGLMKSVEECDYKILTVLTYIPGKIMFHYWKNRYLK